MIDPFTGHGAIFWALFWLLLGPFIVMLYIPIGVVWIIGYGLYLGLHRIFPKLPVLPGDRRP